MIQAGLLDEKTRNEVAAFASGILGALITPQELEPAERPRYHRTGQPYQFMLDGLRFVVIAASRDYRGDELVTVPAQLLLSYGTMRQREQGGEYTHQPVYTVVENLAALGKSLADLDANENVVKP